MKIKMEFLFQKIRLCECYLLLLLALKNILLTDNLNKSFAVERVMVVKDRITLIG